MKHLMQKTAQVTILRYGNRLGHKYPILHVCMYVLNTNLQYMHIK